MYMYVCPFMIRAAYKIVINTSARNLTLYKDEKWFMSFPVAVGKPSTPTPKGTYRIINKAVNPGGPFGARWLGLSIPSGGYGIHGTNDPSSIGKAVSHGCVRMHNNDVITLYNIVSVGTTVEII
ncbi:L,D-transpeptidase [Acetivibrio cellulolyticus]|uniref:L,D-transpeptidase n=1 Tax=Acetivibrio cellulolyticus TaxID=35830 RepID=UPI0001E2D0D2|nr:L,D-transpeptidase [Acetivibrio cellulolyticus]